MVILNTIFPYPEFTHNKVDENKPSKNNDIRVIIDTDENSNNSSNCNKNNDDIITSFHLKDEDTIPSTIPIIDGYYYYYPQTNDVSLTSTPSSTKEEFLIEEDDFINKVHLFQQKNDDKIIDNNDKHSPFQNRCLYSIPTLPKKRIRFSSELSSDEHEQTFKKKSTTNRRELEEEKENFFPISNSQSDEKDSNDSNNLVENNSNSSLYNTPGRNRDGNSAYKNNLSPVIAEPKKNIEFPLRSDTIQNKLLLPLLMDNDDESYFPIIPRSRKSRSGLPFF